MNRLDDTARVKEVEVICSKAHLKRTVARFYFNELTGAWRAHPPASKTKNGGLVYVGKPAPWLYLHENAPLTLRQIAQFVKSGRADSIRRGYKLSCPKCRTNVRGSAERINAVLDVLISRGLSFVELSALDAMLKR